MGFLRLIADFMRAIFEIPLRFIYGVRRWRQKRLAIELAAQDLGKEAKDAKSAKGWLRTLGKGVLFVLLFLLVAFVLWILWYLNDFFDLPRVLGGPLPWLRPFWLPIIVLLVIGTFFLATRLWRLLGPERDANAFPDLEMAWIESEAALAQAGINVRETPLFVVIGKNTGSIDALFSGSKISWLVRQTPNRVDAPFQVYAHRQAIFIAFGSLSVLGKTLEQLAKNAPSDRPLELPKETVFDETKEAPTAAMMVAAKPEPKDDDPLATPNLLADEPVTTPSLMPQFAMADRLATLEELTAHQSRPRWQALAEGVEDEARARFHSAMRIVARGRRPYCAINGALILLPQDSLVNLTDAGQVASAIEDDLQTLARAGQTRCPAWLVISDIHTLAGFDALFGALDSERRQRLLGRDLPFRPDLTDDAAAEMAAGGVASMTASLGQLAQRLFLLESAVVPAAQAFAINGKLFQLVEHLQQRRPALEMLLRRIVLHEAKGGVYFGGFYLAATGTDVNLDQAFVPGLFRLMIDHQSKVTWTDEALAEEGDFQRWAIFGYCAMAAFCVLLVALGYWRWQGIG